MSEIKLNLVDAHDILVGTIHGSYGDYCIAALSAEPETIAELSAALSRYIKSEANSQPFACFRSASEIDPTPWDAGVIVIDLAARIIVSDTTYSQPDHEGQVFYHDGTKLTDYAVLYRLPADWLFVYSVEAYHWSSERRRHERQAKLPLDTRNILYGRPLQEFIAASGLLDQKRSHEGEEAQDLLAERIRLTHANWLLTPREDLRGQSPRDTLLEKQDLIDYDLHTRSLQWSLVGEGPPCLALDSFAFRFAGFGTHEWVVYYDLVRNLLWSATEICNRKPDEAIAALESVKSVWLENPCDDYDGRLPAIIIENERKRLPQTVGADELIINEDCELCRMSAQEVEMGFGPAFWHLDGSHMDDGFAFSNCATIAEWEAEQRQREEIAQDLDRRWREREQWDREFLDAELNDMEATEVNLVDVPDDPF